MLALHVAGLLLSAVPGARAFYRLGSASAWGALGSARLQLYSSR